jgi:hypothetical protein
VQLLFSMVLCCLPPAMPLDGANRKAAIAAMFAQCSFPVKDDEVMSVGFVKGKRNADKGHEGGSHKRSEQVFTC